MRCCDDVFRHSMNPHLDHSYFNSKDASNEQELPAENKREPFGNAAKIAANKWKEMSPDSKLKYGTVVSPLDDLESAHCLEDGRECNMVQCDKCRERFSHFNHFQTRIKVQCEKCRKRFSHVHDFRAHVEECDMRRECEICGEVFGSTDNLSAHVHKNQRQYYECGTCKKLLLSRCSLETHSRMHSGEKPFVCGICGKRYYWETSLKCHAKRHSSRARKNMHNYSTK